MCKKLSCLISLVLVLGLCDISFGVELLVDIGCSGGITQPGWLNERGCRTNSDIGGTLIDFSVEVGFGPGSNACECRVESGVKFLTRWLLESDG